MPPHAVFNQQGRRPVGQVDQDAEIARALQAQEMHRANHPSQHRRSSGGGQAPGHEERQRARDEQLKMALEANPEGFTSVPMLYVNVMLNNVQLKAFVDTGAQMTVMNLACATKCGLQ